MLSDFQHQLILTVVDKLGIGLAIAYAAYAFGRGMERFKRDQAQRATLRTKALIEIFGKCHLFERDYDNAEIALLAQGWIPNSEDAQAAVIEASAVLMAQTDAEKKTDEIERITRENLPVIGMLAHDTVAHFIRLVGECGSQSLVARAWLARPDKRPPGTALPTIVASRQPAWEGLMKERQKMESLIRDG